MAVESTVVVKFGTSVAADQQFVVVELDDVVNNERTQFGPDDSPGFIVHFDETELRIDRVECSSGSVQGGNRATRSRTVLMSFANTDDDQQLPHIPSGTVNWNWRGSGTAVTAGTRVNSPNIAVDGRQVRAESNVPAIGEATYSISCFPYVLTPPALTLADQESWQILIVVYMEAV